MGWKRDEAERINAKIRELHTRGFSDREIADAVGITYSSVAQRRRKWRRSPNLGHTRIGLAYGVETT